METIKKYLGNRFSDDNQIKLFLKKHEPKIIEFFNELCKEENAEFTEGSPLNEIIEKEVETAKIRQAENGLSEEQSEDNLNKNIQQTKDQSETNMPIILDPGEKSDDEKIHSEVLAFQIKNKQITFPNGKVNQQYEVDFDFEKFEFAEIAEVSFEGLEKIGLQYFPDEKKIKGTPMEAGDHKVRMLFKIKNYEDRSPLEREVIFIINPDPRVLWSKNIPTPEDIEYYKPDSDKAFVKVESKKTKRVFENGIKDFVRKDMVAASQRGRSHAIEGKPRDDDFALYFEKETEWYVIVVADGAGSAQYSRKGSEIACNTVKDICTTKLLAYKDEFAKIAN